MFVGTSRHDGWSIEWFTVYALNICFNYNLKLDYACTLVTHALILLKLYFLLLLRPLGV